MNREFQVTPPSTLAWVVGLGLPTLPVVIGGVLLAVVPSLEGRAPPPVAIALFAGISLLVVLGMLVALRRHHVRLQGGVLRIAAGWYTLRQAVGDIDFDASGVVDLDKQADWRPQLRTNGIGLPGFHAGHYRRWSPPRRRLFCLITDRRHLLGLRFRDGREALVSLRDPKQALAQLRAVASSSGRT